MERPQFQHAIINELFNYSWSTLYPTGIIDKVLALPRESLIEDLLKVLEHGMAHHYSYIKEYNEDEIGWEKMGFLNHAVYFLAELKATNSKDTISRLFYFERDFYDYFFGDFITENLSPCLMRIYQDDYASLVQIVKDADAYEYVRMACTQVLENTVMLKPELRSTIIPFYKDIITELTERNKNLNMVNADDCGVLGCISAEILDMKATELDEAIKMAYEEDLVDMMFCGDYDEFKKELDHSKYQSPPQLYQPMNEYYEYWYEEIKKREEEEKKLREQQKIEVAKRQAAIERQQLNMNKIGQKAEIKHGTFQYTGKKVGRNEPCPCGSGKKYKKCHGKK